MPETKRFLLRLDPDLFDAIRRWADDDLRSINAQIEYLLTENARRAGRLEAPRRSRARAASSASSLPDGGSKQTPKRRARSGASSTASRAL
jgi:hypothetical protein